MQLRRRAVDSELDLRPFHESMAYFAFLMDAVPHSQAVKPVNVTQNMPVRTNHLSVLLKISGFETDLNSMMTISLATFCWVHLSVLHGNA
jgi:hypothetical protein